MAEVANHVISPVESNHSSTTTTTSSRSSSSSRLKSFGSLGSRKPRDSLEKMRRQRNTSLAETPPPFQRRLLSSVRNATVQTIPEDDDEDAMESVPLPLAYRPPIRQGAPLCERYPKGKASLLVFLLNFIAMYSFSAAIAGILDIFHNEHHMLRAEELSSTEEKWFHMLHLLFQNSVSRVFYPFAGFIADVYIGRHRMIHVGFWLLFAGYSIITISFALGSNGIFQGRHSVLESQYVIRGVAFLIISAGGGAFEATIIPFGVDQLQGASSAEISSYFYFYYFSRHLGMACGITVYGISTYFACVYSTAVLLSETTDEDEACNVVQPLATTVVLTFGIILYVCLNHWLFRNTLWENPVKLVAKVLCYAATAKRHLPVRRRAFRYGEGKKSRIDLAKVQYDGKYPAEKVEDVKTFCRVLLLMFTLIPTLFSENAFNILASYEVNKTIALHYPSSTLSIDLYPNIFYGVNAISILLTLPIVNFIVIPCCPKLTIRARIAIGLVLYLAGDIAAVIIHSVGHGEINKVQLWTLLLPIAIGAVAEVLTTVSVLEFIYAQSPESMKGLLTGLYFFLLGLSSVASSAVSYLYVTTLSSQELVLLYSAFTVTQVVGLVFYGVVASLHKNRLRPDGDSFSRQEQMFIEDQLHTSVIS